MLLAEFVTLRNGAILLRRLNQGAKRSPEWTLKFWQFLIPDALDP
jgi:hypothetical protein